MKKFPLYLFIILSLVLSCVKKDAPVPDDEKTKIDSNRKCGCPDDFKLN